MGLIKIYQFIEMILIAFLLIGICLASGSRKKVYHVEKPSKFLYLNTSQYLRAQEDQIKVNGTYHDDWAVRWIIEDAGNGKICLRSYYGTYLKAFPEEDHQEQTEGCGPKEQWEMIQTVKGTDYYKIKSFYGYYLKIWPQEEENNQILITLQTYTSYYLGVNADGATFSFDEEIHSKNIWELVEVKEGVFCIKSIYDTYIRAWPERNSLDQAPWCKEAELWQFEKTNFGYTNIKSHFGTYLNGLDFRNLLNTPTITPKYDSQKWTVSLHNEKIPVGKGVVFKSHSGQYLHPSSGNSNVKGSSELNSDCIWHLEKVKDSYCIKSNYGTYLRAWADGDKLDQAPACRELEWWTFLPSPRGGHMINIESYFGNFIRAWPNDDKLDLAPWDKEWEDWMVLDAETLTPADVNLVN